MATASQLYIDLCRRLNETLCVVGVSQAFAELPDNRARVEFAHEIIVQFQLFAELDNMQPITSKNSTLMEDCLQKARAMDDGMAKVAAYTSALGHAGSPSEERVVLLERSEALRNIGKRKAALDDIRRVQTYALVDNEPPHLILEDDKLTQPETPAHNLPEISHGVNERIPCACDAIAINASPQCGRCVVAVKDIEIGDVLVKERPYASVILYQKDTSSKHCHHCLQSSYSLIACDRCAFAYFCSEACKSAAWTAFHQYECPVIGMMISLDLTILSLAALRVALLATNEYMNMAENAEPVDNAVYASGQYKEIHGLCTNSHLRPISDLFKRAVNAALIYEVIKRHTTFLNDEDPAKSGAFKALLLQHLQTGPSNFHELTAPPEDEKSMEPNVEIGGGAYSFLSLINHSCSPNVVRQNVGDVIVLTALTRIKKGEQLYDNYGYHYATHTREERQKQLKSQYYFDCNCVACQNDWPLYDQLPELNEQPDVTFHDSEIIKNGSREDVVRVLDLYIEKANVLAAHAPCKNLASVQEFIKQCFLRIKFSEEN